MNDGYFINLKLPDQTLVNKEYIVSIEPRKRELKNPSLSGSLFEGFRVPQEVRRLRRITNLVGLALTSKYRKELSNSLDDGGYQSLERDPKCKYTKVRRMCPKKFHR